MISYMHFKGLKSVISMNMSQNKNKKNMNQICVKWHIIIKTNTVKPTNSGHPK